MGAAAGAASRVRAPEGAAAVSASGTSRTETDGNPRPRRRSGCGGQRHLAGLHQWEHLLRCPWAGEQEPLRVRESRRQRSPPSAPRSPPPRPRRGCRRHRCERCNGRCPPYDLRDPASRPECRVTPWTEHRGEFGHLHFSGLTSLVERSDDVSPRAVGSVGPGFERLADGCLDPPSSLTKPSAQSPVVPVGRRGRPWIAAERSEQAVVQRQRLRRPIRHSRRRPSAVEGVESGGQKVHDAKVRRWRDRGGAASAAAGPDGPTPRNDGSRDLPLRIVFAV